MSGNYTHVPFHDHNQPSSRAPLGKRLRWWISRNKPWSYVVLLALALIAYDVSRLYAHLTYSAPRASSSPSAPSSPSTPTAPEPQREQEKQPVDPLVNFQILCVHPCRSWVVL